MVTHKGFFLHSGLTIIIIIIIIIIINMKDNSGQGCSDFGLIIDHQRRSYNH